MSTYRFPEGSQAAEVALRTSWEAYQLAGTIPPEVRPEIAASWRRSAQAHLAAAFSAAPVDEAALRALPHAGTLRRRFLTASAAVADQLSGELPTVRAAVVVCDEFGIVLHRAGRPEVLRAVERVNLVPGGVWSERVAGTNGLGLALAIGDAVHVHGAEHYLEALHAYSCTAAVVRHPVTREMLGVLGIAAGTEVPAAYTRPLIARAAIDVERELHDGAHGRERDLMDHYLDRRAGRASPFLTVDRAGHTVIQSARLIESTSGEDVALLLDVARKALHADGDATEELELSHGRVRAETQLVRDGDETLGAVVSLRRVGSRRAAPATAATDAWAPMVGRSPAMLRLFREADRVARERAPVAIWGEAGSGKLTLARGLHRQGGAGPLTVVHCALPGWDRALADAAGREGTIVLHRVHVLAPDAQLALCDHLDALADGAERPWVIALMGAYAPDACPELLSRVARVSLTVPPLRDRDHDLRLLIDRWCDERERATGTRPALRPDAHEALAARPWAGNVRELHNTLEAAALRGGTVIGVESLDLGSHTRPGAGAEPPVTLNLRELEHDAIDAALRRTGGNVSRAARELGIGRATLHRRLRAYRLLS